MKWIATVAVAVPLLAGPFADAQDAASEERYNKLSGQIEDLRAGQESLAKRIEALAKDMDALRGQVNKPTGNFASEEDLKRLADAVKEIDRKRLEDYERIHLELKNLGKSLAAPAPAVSKRNPSSTSSESAASEKSSVPDKVFEYEVKKGDTLSIIVQAYRDNNIKITTDQILKANPGLKPEKLRVGQKIFIPPPKS